MEAGKKRSSCFDDSKHGKCIFGQTEQQFKIQSHFGIFGLVIEEGQLY